MAQHGEGRRERVRPDRDVATARDGADAARLRGRDVHIAAYSRCCEPDDPQIGRGVERGEGRVPPQKDGVRARP